MKRPQMQSILVSGETDYSDVAMSAMASQITSVTIVYPTVCSGTDQRKHQRSASLAFVWGIHRWPVNSPHWGPVITRKMFPFDDVIMIHGFDRHSPLPFSIPLTNLNVLPDTRPLIGTTISGCSQFYLEVHLYLYLILFRGVHFKFKTWLILQPNSVRHFCLTFGVKSTDEIESYKQYRRS